MAPAGKKKPARAGAKKKPARAGARAGAKARAKSPQPKRILIEPPQPPSLPTPDEERPPLWARFLRRLRSYFLTGLVVAMPLVITLYLANWFIGFVDNQILPLLWRVLPPESSAWLDTQGIGLLIAVVLLVLLGWLAGYVFGQSLINLGERIVDRVPLVRSIYHALKQIFQTVLSDQTSSFQQVCLVEYPRKNVYALAFITTDIQGEIKNKIGTRRGDKSIAIFLPTTPNPTSGFLLFLPQSKVQMLNMSVENGLKMVISGGLLEPEHIKK